MPSAPERPDDNEVWQRVIRELTDDLAVDALARDRAGKPPFDEIARLREAGLPALLTPPGPGRTGTDWRTACAVVRELAAADSSIAELMGRHYVLAWSARLFGLPGEAEPFELRTAREQWLLGGSAELPEPESEPDLTLTRAKAGYVLDGRRRLAAGITVVDRLIVGAPTAHTGELLIALVDPAHPGVTAAPVEEPLGQRLADAGSVTFDRVPVPAEHIIGAAPRDEHAVTPFTALAPLALRLMLVQVVLGIAEGALAEARDLSRAVRAARPASDGGDGEYGEYGKQPAADPYLLLVYGELAASAYSAAAVVERATRSLARGLEAGAELGIDERADIAVLVAGAEVLANRAAVDITTRILEFTAGAGSVHGDPGLDRFWRNARVLTAQNPLAHRLSDIGDHYLNGTSLRRSER
ncbi:acyl-CoA dehydrogenase family protein [Streptomyces sp. NPDC002889]|uniref:acyl-CoA dehydrogenase family protein n=1 Tax=Streptomyces sp. NPDC002889 TaxID=3364669 RepID=UPI00368FA822